MNFAWKNIKPIQQNLTNVRENYRKITEEFCKTYYSIYDNDFLKLENIYKPESIFTYLDEEFVGFQSVSERIKQYNIWKFKHGNININAQPIGQKSLLINITGLISVNNSMIEQRFVETILLQRDNDDIFYIYHTMFKVIE